MMSIWVLDFLSSLRLPQGHSDWWPAGLLLATIPGFSWLVFLVIGLILLMISLTHYFPA